MGLGLTSPVGQTEEIAIAECERICEMVDRMRGDFKMPSFDLVWHTHSALADELIEARGSTRRKLIESMAFPKPTYVENLIYCDELKKTFGDVSDVQGFDGRGVFELPKGHGLLIPNSRNGQIVELTFYRLSELLKAKVKAVKV
ncbi:MAG: hypothetical protein KF855_03320 [Acidobacteria bacterium]|nr:hypothetical protein [Acidobacteriota bacterium]